MLSNDAWLEQQLVAELSQSADLEKIVRMEQLKISQGKLRISKIQEGWRKSKLNLPNTVKLLLRQNRRLEDFVIKWRTGVSAPSRPSCCGRN